MHGSSMILGVNVSYMKTLLLLFLGKQIVNNINNYTVGSGWQNEDL